MQQQRLYFEICWVPLQGVLCASVYIYFAQNESTDIATLTQISVADTAPFRHFGNLQLKVQTADRKRMMN